MGIAAVKIPFDADISVISHRVELFKDADTAVLEREDSSTKEQPAKERWIVEGFAATADIDSEDDKIDAKALEEAAEDFRRYTTILFNHNKDRPIGKILDVKVKGGGGLFVKVEISKSEPDIWEKIKDGTLNKFSIRGRILEVAREFSRSSQRWIRVIKKLKLFETSIVSVPANPAARTLRWYISKALEEFTEQGGVLPAEETDSGGQDMKKQDIEETLQSDAATEMTPVEEPGSPADVDQPAEKAEANQPEDQAPAPETETEGESEQTDEDIQLQMSSGDKEKVQQALSLVDKLIPKAAADMKAALQQVKGILTRLSAAKYPYPYPKKDLGEKIMEFYKDKVLPKAAARILASEIEDMDLLLSFAEEHEEDPVRKHFIRGVRMLFGSDAEATVKEKAPEDAVTDMVSTVTALAEQIEAVSKRIESIETDETETKEGEQVAEKPAEDTAEKEETPTAEKQHEVVDTIKCLDEKLDGIRKSLESLDSRLNKVEKTEGVSQAIKGQDVSKAEGGSNPWMGIFAPAIAQALGHGDVAQQQ